MNPVQNKISIISPVYGCRESLYELYERILQVMKKINGDFELILIDDASPDNSWEMIRKIAEKDNRVKGLLFSRNFGQHSAITAGLEKSQGDFVVVMDCDLQDQPEEIPRLYEKAKQGFDLVLGRRQQRNDPLHKKIFSFIFYRLLAYLTETRQDPKIGNFGIYHRNVIKAVCEMKDRMRYFPAMIRWVGFNHTSIDLQHADRKHGKTTYTFRKLLHLALDVMLAFSDKPLRLTVKAGLIISASSIIYALITFIRYLYGYIQVLGYTSLILSIWFFSGMIIFILGFVGLYIGKIFENVKQRPLYIIKEEINFET